MRWSFTKDRNPPDAAIAGTLGVNLHRRPPVPPDGAHIGPLVDAVLVSLWDRPNGVEWNPRASALDGLSRPHGGLQRQPWGRSAVMMRNDFAIGNSVVYLLLRRLSAIPFAMNNGSNVRAMSSYVPIEYPKWVTGVLVQNAEEEQARRAALAEAAEVARAVELNRPPSPRRRHNGLAWSNSSLSARSVFRPPCSAHDP